MHGNKKMNNLLLILQSFMFNPYKSYKNYNSKLWFTERYAENYSWQAVAGTWMEKSKVGCLTLILSLC